MKKSTDYRPSSTKEQVSNVEVTVRYHLMTHTLFLLPITDCVAISTWWRLSNSSRIVVSVVVSLLPLPHVYRELLEPASIDRVLMSDLSVRQQDTSTAENVRSSYESSLQRQRKRYLYSQEKSMLFCHSDGRPCNASEHIWDK